MVRFSPRSYSSIAAETRRWALIEINFGAARSRRLRFHDERRTASQGAHLLWRESDLSAEHAFGGVTVDQTLRDAVVDLDSGWGSSDRDARLLHDGRWPIDGFAIVIHVSGGLGAHFRRSRDGCAHRNRERAGQASSAPRIAPDTVQLGPRIACTGEPLLRPMGNTTIWSVTDACPELTPFMPIDRRESPQL
jgi:hypothetical protein